MIVKCVRKDRWSAIRDAEASFEDDVHYQERHVRQGEDILTIGSEGALLGISRKPSRPGAQRRGIYDGNSCFNGTYHSVSPVVFYSRSHECTLGRLNQELSQAGLRRIYSRSAGCRLSVVQEHLVRKLMDRMTWEYL